jgi:hypothetical protein
MQLALQLVTWLVLVSFHDVQSQAQDRCSSSITPCKAGCYESDDNNICEVTPAGFFSPNGDDALYACPVGSYSYRGFRQCKLCAPGTATNETQTAVCPACRPGEYAPAFGSTVCLKCNPEHYFGYGAYAMFNEGGEWFCLAPDAQTSAPSISMAPSPLRSVTISSKEPSAAPTTTVAPQSPSPPPSLRPSSSRAPSNQPSLAGTQSSRSSKSQVFWKFLFPFLVAAVLLLALAAAACVWHCKKKKEPKPSTPKAAAAAAWSPTSTLAGKTIVVQGGGGESTTTMGHDGDDDSFVLRDLYGHDIPVPPPMAKNKKFFNDNGSDMGSISDLYYDDVSIVDSTADDYSLKF